MTDGAGDIAGATDGATHLDGPRFVEWVEWAQPKDEVVYCRAERLHPDAAAMPAQMAQAGVVDLVQKRSGRFWLYIARRRAAPLPVAPSLRRRASRPAGSPPRRAVERALYRICCSSARAGLIFPGNAALARMLGLSGALAASYRLRRLVAAGLITIEQTAPTGPRIVTIVKTGERTGSARSG